MEMFVTTAEAAPDSSDDPAALRARISTLETQALQTGQLLKSVLEASTQGIISVDVTGTITLVNRGAEYIFGYLREELIGQRVEVLLPERVRHSHVGHRGEYFREPRNRPMGQGSELTGRRKDGTEFPAEITLSYIESTTGPATTVFVNDITLRKQAQAEVAQARDRFTAILDASSRVAIIATEIDGTIRLFNSGAENMLGYRAEEVIGKKTLLAFHLDSEIEQRSSQIFRQQGVRVSGFEAFAEPARRGAYDEPEWTYLRKDGSRLTVNLAVTAVRDRQGALTGFLGVATDITERVVLKQQLEDALKRTDADLHAIVRAAPLAIVTVDPDGKVMSWNEAAEKMYGYSAKEVIGHSNPAIPKENFWSFREWLSSTLRGHAFQIQAKRVRKDGRVIDVSLSFAPLHAGNGGFSGAVVISEDISAKIKAEADLARTRASLANAREDEARRIARELHDDITQRLALLSMDLGSAAADQAIDAGTTTALKSFQKRIADVSDGVREISHRMHPSILDDLGLCDSLEFLCMEFEKREGVPVDYMADSLPPNLRPGAASCLYRVAQESLHNISKYAHARDVTVRLTSDASVIRLSVIDSGVGFDAGVQKTGLGFHSMRERASLANGTLTIVSEPGVGTRVTVTLPLEAGPQ